MKITQWEPKGFQLETTTVWGFKNRDNWAPHDGCCCRNWSLYITFLSNLILPYLRPRELVLDYFCDAITISVKTKLLGRRCITHDISLDALELAKEKLDFQLSQKVPSGNGDTFVEPKLVLGDARDLPSLETGSIDLICAYPPYAGIINYSVNEVEGDLSIHSVPEFQLEMQKVARESYLALKPGQQCAILIRESQKSKHNRFAYAISNDK